MHEYTHTHTHTYVHTCMIQICMHRNAEDRLPARSGSYNSIDVGMGIDVRRSYSRANSLEMMRASERVDRSCASSNESVTLSPLGRKPATKSLTT